MRIRRDKHVMAMMAISWTVFRHEGVDVTVEVMRREDLVPMDDGHMMDTMSLRMTVKVVVGDTVDAGDALAVVSAHRKPWTKSWTICVVHELISINVNSRQVEDQLIRIPSTDMTAAAATKTRAESKSRAAAE